MNVENGFDFVDTTSTSVFCKTSGLERFHQSGLSCILRLKHVNFLYLLALHTMFPIREGSAWSLLSSILYQFSVGITRSVIILKCPFYAFFRLNESEADDLTQEVFISVYQGIYNFR